MINNALRFAFFLIVVRPVLFLMLGISVRNRERLPANGPAIIVANHNSHLDAFVLMALLGMKRLHLVRPVAAADHFLRNRLLAWFTTKIIGIIPLKRNLKGVRSDPLAGICEALDEGKILIIFPEGSRGDPEVRAEFKTGVAHIAKRYPDLPITPVFLHGLGRALPRGEGILVPFFCDCFVGEHLTWTGDRGTFMTELEDAICQLASQAHVPKWGDDYCATEKQEAQSFDREGEEPASENEADSVA